MTRGSHHVLEQSLNLAAVKKELPAASETAKPAPMSQDFLAQAGALLGSKGLTTEPDALAPWLTDWRGRFTGKALALASPASVEEVSALVRLCAAHRIGIVPQGGNSGMSGGATPDPSGNQLLLSLRRMNRIREVSREKRSATCEAGVILQTLQEAAEAEGMRFPLTLGGKGSATVAGLVSTNAGGTQVLRHGSMRTLVLGLEAVMADGSVLDQLIPLKKDNRGFDLKQLLIGSEGTLGIVTAATVKLEPAVARRAVLWAGLGSIHAARALLLHAQDVAGAALEGFEVMPQHCLETVLAYLPGSRRPLEGTHQWHALVELVADAEAADGLDALALRLLETALDRGIVEDAVIASSESQAEALWKLRETVPSGGRAGGAAARPARPCSTTSACRSSGCPTSSKHPDQRSRRSGQVCRSRASGTLATETSTST